MDWIFQLAAHLAGFSDDELNRVEAALPATRKLIDIIIQAQPIIESAKPVVEQALEEWKVVGPILQMVLTTVLKKARVEGTAPADALLRVRGALAEIERQSSGQG